MINNKVDKQHKMCIFSNFFKGKEIHTVTSIHTVVERDQSMAEMIEN